ncbi:MAG TPA: hypothetical protein VD931_06505 [Baekduia sp.]|nr:hypothetical protein [Baekduia sp.]
MLDAASIAGDDAAAAAPAPRPPRRNGPRRPAAEIIDHAHRLVTAAKKPLELDELLAAIPGAGSDRRALMKLLAKDARFGVYAEEGRVEVRLVLAPSGAAASSPAFRAGRTAHAAGADMLDNPHAAGTAEAAAWEDGWIAAENARPGARRWTEGPDNKPAGPATEEEPANVGTLEIDGAEVDELEPGVAGDGDDGQDEPPTDPEVDEDDGDDPFPENAASDEAFHRSSPEEDGRGILEPIDPKAETEALVRMEPGASARIEVHPWLLRQHELVKELAQATALELEAGNQQALARVARENATMKLLEHARHAPEGFRDAVVVLPDLARVQQAVAKAPAEPAKATSVPAASDEPATLPRGSVDRRRADNARAQAMLPAELQLDPAAIMVGAVRGVARPTIARPVYLSGAPFALMADGLPEGYAELRPLYPREEWAQLYGQAYGTPQDDAKPQPPRLSKGGPRCGQVLRAERGGEHVIGPQDEGFFVRLD